ncbi:MAG: hypothetical protein ACR2NT_13640 [Acidimicrobiia bacterium]
MIVPARLPCVDCDGTLHLLTVFEEELPVEPGEIIAYRCDSCLERFDIVWD